MRANIINFKDKFTSAKPLLEQINVMAVYEMNIFQKHCLMYLCKNGKTPSIFKLSYTVKPINKYTARSKNLFCNSLCKKSFSKFKLTYRGAHLWNKFISPNRSNCLLEAGSINMFKLRLKRDYLCMF